MNNLLKDLIKRIFSFGYCRNPSLGLATKARVCKVAGQKGSQESHNIPPGV